MPIRKLPTLLINQIAAGEVIERPASVVKELVENSLDAGATRVDVTIEDGGRQLIRISDDGHGIPQEELPLAIAPHATSKLSAAEDLEAIATFGFRGEALASVASISRLRLTSRATHYDEQGKPSLDESAYLIEAGGDEASDPMPASAAPGTVIEVRDLFFNTPARRKFMRTAPTEYGHVNEAFCRIAMMHPGVAFTLTNNGRKTQDFAATDDWARRCIDIVGKDLEEGLMPFEHQDPPERGGYRVWGLAGQPSLARATAKFQYVSLNGRVIKDRKLTHAIKEAYRGLMPMDRHPVAVVFIEMDPRAVDVNVHPAKAEVRFHNPSAVHGLILHAIRQRLLGEDLTPAATFAPSSNGPSLTPAFTPPPPIGDTAGAPAMPPPKPANTPEANRGFVDYFKRMDPTQKGFVYEQVKREMAEDSEDPLLRQAEENGMPAAETPDPDAAAPPAAKPRDILQVHNSYVVTQDEHGLIIVDQHALHERVMFEQLRQRVLGQGKNLESQRLLMPEVLAANAKRQSTLEGLGPLLVKIGVEAEPIGPEQVAIHAFPSFLFSRNVEPLPFMEELLDKAEAGDLQVTDATAEEAALHEVLDMMSCKAAIKAGDKMSEQELSDLLSKRDDIERSSNCPHGRPTTLRLTLGDLEKQFGRA